MKPILTFITKALMLVPFVAVAAGAPDETPGPACNSTRKASLQLKSALRRCTVWIGQTKAGRRIVVTQSPKGTWTILAVKPDKTDKDGRIACMVLDDGGNAEPEDPT